MVDVPKYPEVSVTDRTFKEYESNLGGLDLSRYISKGARVLVCGSGIHCVFERIFKEKRKDLNIYSFDLSLGLMTIDEDGNPTTNGYQIHNHEGLGIVYEYEDNKSDVNILRGADALQFDRNRKRMLISNQEAVAASAIYLPFQNNSFDYMIDVMGPVMYLSRSIRNKYLKEVSRCLKRKGVLITNIDLRNEKVSLKENELDCKEIKPGAYKIFRI
jgi:SAM-dependent methyltransferase